MIISGKFHHRRVSTKISLHTKYVLTDAQTTGKRNASRSLLLVMQQKNFTGNLSSISPVQNYFDRDRSMELFEAVCDNGDGAAWRASTTSII